MAPSSVWTTCAGAPCGPFFIGGDSLCASTWLADNNTAAMIIERYIKTPMVNHTLRTEREPRVAGEG